MRIAGNRRRAFRDEHLAPGRGSQPCAQVCERIADSDFDGVVVVEVSTRRCCTRYDRAALLAESLLFARLHLQPTLSIRIPAPRPAATPVTS